MKGFVTIVSGLPRSGTSMMMRMLQAGGMEVVTSETYNRKDLYNPFGYFETDRTWESLIDSKWLRGQYGKAVKVIVPYIEGLGQAKCRVIFMVRDFPDILASIRRTGLDLANPKFYPCEIPLLLKLAGGSAGFLAERAIHTLYVPYERVLEDPETWARTVRDFLGVSLEAGKMASAVVPDPEKRRQNVTL